VIQLLDESRGGIPVAQASVGGACSFNGTYTNCITEIAAVWNPAGMHQALVTYSGDQYHTPSATPFIADVN
jgi:hypothetical protein